MMVSVAFQKKETKGLLMVGVKPDGGEFKFSQTTAAYGMVMVATR